MGKQTEDSHLIDIISENDSFRTTADTFRDILLRTRKKREISEDEISDFIKYIIVDSEEWKITELMYVLKEVMNHVNWIRIFELFDDSKFVINSLDSFNKILECWKCINGENTFPYRSFFKVWDNKETQESFLKYFIEGNDEHLRVYNNVFLTRIITPEDLKKDRLKDDINLASHFNCLELFKIIKELNQEEMIKKIYSISVDWVFLGLSSVYPFCSKIFDDLFVQYLKRERLLFLCVIFKNNSSLLITKLAETRDRGFSLNKLLDIILELKILPSILEITSPSFFCYEILILSSRRDHLNLSIWITNTYKFKKECFAGSLIGYIMEKFSKIEEKKKTNVKHNDEVAMDKKLYPLTFEITLNIMQTLDTLYNSFSRELLQNYNKLKAMLPLELRNINEKKLSLEQQSNDFITKIVDGTCSTEKAVDIISNLVCGSLNDRELAMNIFNTLLDNYHNFHKISSSKTLAFLFGKLIDKRLFPKSQMHKALRTLSSSLRKTGSKEFEFALHTLSMFCDNYKSPDFDSFFEGIQKISQVREFLTERRKDFVLEDIILEETTYDNFLDAFFVPFESKIVEQLYSELTEDSLESTALKTTKYLLCSQFCSGSESDIDIYSTNTADASEKNMTAILVNELNDENNDQTGKLSFKNINDLYIDHYRKNMCFFRENTNLQHFIRYFFEKKIFETNNHFILIKYFNTLGEEYYHVFCEIVFDMLRYVHRTRISNEMLFAKSLGQFFGKFTIGLNRIFTLESFNLYEYVIECVEQRRVFFCVFFMVYFIRQGKTGLFFRPKNPFLMNLIYLLNEIGEYSKDVLKEEIDSLLSEFKLTHIKQTNILASHVSIDSTTLSFFDDYNLSQYDKIHTKVISMGIDFSIREITFPLMDRIIGVSTKTMEFLFQKQRDRHGEYYLHDYKRNFIANLINNLTYVCALEPTIAAIVGNVPYFLKMAGLDVENENIHILAKENFVKCSVIIRNVITTRAWEEMELDNGHRITTNDLRILQSCPEIETMHFEPIKQTEYKEIRTKLSKIHRKQPDKHFEHVMKKWNLIIKILEGYINMDTKIEKSFSKETDDRCTVLYMIDDIVTYVLSTVNHDSLVEKISQKIISFLLRTNDETNMEFMFYFLKKLFNLSFKSQCEVSSWLIYSNDDRKFNVKLYTGFINHGFVKLQELDQYLSQKVRDDNYLNFILILLDQLNMPYEFINTIEALSKLNEEKYDVKIYNMLKEISYTTFFNHKELSACNLFDEYVKIIKYSFSPEKYLSTFFNVLNDKVKDSRTLIIKCFIISWDHFVRFFKVPSRFKYLKINCLPLLLREYSPNLGIEIALELFCNSIERKNFLFQKMILQFFIMSGYATLEVLHLLVPRNVPYFCFNFIVLCKYYILDFVQYKKENTLFDAFRISKELLFPLKYYEEKCNLLLYEIYDFFRLVEILTREEPSSDENNCRVIPVIDPDNRELVWKNIQLLSNELNMQKTINHSLFYDISDFFNSNLKNNQFSILKNLFNKRKRRTYLKSCDFSTNDALYRSIINYCGDDLVNIIMTNNLQKDVVITALVDNLSDTNPLGFEENCRTVLVLSDHNEWFESLMGLIFYRVLGPNPPFLLLKVCKELFHKHSTRINISLKEKINDIIKSID